MYVECLTLGPGVEEGCEERSIERADAGEGEEELSRDVGRHLELQMHDYEALMLGWMEVRFTTWQARLAVSFQITIVLAPSTEVFCSQ